MAEITVEMHKQFIRQGRYSDDQIKELINKGTLNANNLIEENVLTKERLEKIFYVSPEQHKARVSNKIYSHADIKKLIDTGTLKESELITEGLLTRDEMQVIMKRPKAPITIEFDFGDVPPLQENRVDVFVLGIAGSGKSSFMAGLIYYAKKNGRLNIEPDNLSGFKYAQKLTQAVKQKMLPPATPAEYVQYMACDFTDDQNKQHPLTFIEMSGELFEKCYGVAKERMPGKLQEYLFNSKNNKIIFLTIDYNIHSADKYLDTPQETQFDFILRFLNMHGTLKSTEAICILITKWDMCKDTSERAAVNFLEEEYLNLVNLCKKYKDENKLKFEVFTFSLGSFDEGKSYEYIPRDSAFLFKWLCSFSPIVKKGKSTFWDTFK